MHTTEGNKARFFHNGDFSGNVQIVVKATGEEIEIPFEDIKTLVAEYVRRDRIRWLQQATDDAALGLGPFSL